MIVEKSNIILSVDKGVDFNSSFVRWITKDDSIGRFSVEAVCDVFNVHGTLINSYSLLSGVIACDVYGKGKLFHEPSYFYQALFSKKGEYKIFRTHAKFDDKADDNGKIADRFKTVEVNIVKNKLTQLNSLEEIDKAINASAPILSFSVIENIIGNHFAVIHYPVKHINLHLINKEYQVETGPVLLINSEIKSLQINKLNIVYLAYNTKNLLRYIPFVSKRRVLFPNLRYYIGEKKCNSFNQLYILN